MAIMALNDKKAPKMKTRSWPPAQPNGLRLDQMSLSHSAGGACSASAGAQMEGCLGTPACAPSHSRLPPHMFERPLCNTLSLCAQAPPGPPTLPLILTRAAILFPAATNFIGQRIGSIAAAGRAARVAAVPVYRRAYQISRPPPAVAAPHANHCRAALGAWAPSTRTAQGSSSGRRS